MKIKQQVFEFLTKTARRKRAVSGLISSMCDRSARKLSFKYKILQRINWGGTTPLSHNHLIDVYHRFPDEGVFDWGEIGFVNVRCIYKFDRPVVEELGCADGFFYFYFYSYIPDIKYIGCDLDEVSLQTAWEKAVNPEVFVKADFLREMPQVDGLTNVLWNASIQMFETEEIRAILSTIKQRLAGTNGILSGSATVVDENFPAEKYWKYCRNPFKNDDELYILLKEYFKFVFVYRDRGMGHMALFVATDGDWFNDKS